MMRPHNGGIRTGVTPMLDFPAASELAGCHLDFNVREWGENMLYGAERQEVHPRILNELI